MNNGIIKKRKKKHLLIEISTALAAFALLVYGTRSMLIFGETTLAHDNYYWYYPVFQFFAENLLNGQYPFWNPFTHGGEPFYPVSLQFRLLDPNTIATIYIANLFTDDIVMIFNWNRIIQSLIMVTGIYIVLRPFAMNMLIRLSLIFILLFSSVMLGSFRQDAIINQFLWVPFITFFLLRIIYYRNTHWYNWLALSALTGLNWQSYFFTGTWIYLFFFFTGLLCFKRSLLVDMFRTKGIWARLGVSALIIIAMMGPNIMLIKEKNDFVFPIRMASITESAPGPSGESGSHSSISGIRMPYSMIASSGSFSEIWDFIQLPSPEGNEAINWSQKEKWGNPTEAYMYFGILTWAIALMGLIAGKHDLKPLFTMIAGGYAFLMLGPAGGLHQLLYLIYPPMWFFRHTHALVLFFSFAFLYFYVLGCNHLYLQWRTSLFGSRENDLSKNMIGLSIFVIIFLATMLSAISGNNEIGSIKYIFPHLLVLISTGWLINRYCGKTAAYVGIIAGYAILIFILSSNKFYFLTSFTLAFVLPAVLFFHYRKTNMQRLTLLLVSIAAISLMGDLGHSFINSNSLFMEKTSPGPSLNIDTSVQKSSMPQERMITYDRYKNFQDQPMRYISLAGRSSYVFSTLTKNPGRGDPGELSDGERKKLAELDPRSFEFALKRPKRYNFLSTKKYHELINLKIDPEIIKTMFAVGMPVFQIKNSTIVIDGSRIPDLVKDTGTSKALSILKEHVFIEEVPEDQPEGLAVSYKEDIVSPREIRNLNFNYIVGDSTYGSINLTVNSDRPSVLYWADGYDKWWRAYIKEREVPIYRANMNFKAIFLPEGTSDIRFVYDPIMYKRALFIFYGVFILSMVFALLLFILQRQNKETLL